MITFIIIIIVVIVSLGLLIYYRTDKKIKETQRLYSNPREKKRSKLGNLGSYYGFGTRIIGNGYVADVLFGLPVWIVDRVSYVSSPSIENNYGWLRETKTGIYDPIHIPWDWKSLLKIVSIYYGCAIFGIGIVCLCIYFG